MSETENASLAQAESVPEETKLEEPKLEESAPEELSAEEPKPAAAEGEDFGDLLSSYSQQSHPSSGNLMSGHVVKVTDSEVIVDVGYKCEGVIAIEEFLDDWGNLRVKPGDAVQVMMESAEERDGYVVLSDTHYPGWRVYVDGEPRPLLRADYLFRAVAVPAGTHKVSFEYAPLSVTVGLAISAIAVLIWVGLFVYYRRARRER